MAAAQHASSRSQQSASAEVANTPQATGTWPHQLSHDPSLRVSDVLARVRTEFPALTTSKLRFLDAHGLVTPQRTSSGYRQYSAADVERLLYVLRQQRDHYRPLSVIADHLSALDDGRMHESHAPSIVGEESPEYVSIDAFLAASAIDTQTWASIADAGLVRESMPDRVAVADVPVAVAAGAYLRAGGDARELKALARAAGRQADQAEAVAAPDRAAGRSGDAEGRADDLADAAVSVFGACVRAARRR